MNIVGIEITNYKSFHRSPVINLHSGINVVVGENNTGKTSLAEALGLKFKNQPHRSRETFRPPFVTPESISQVRLEFSMSEAEFRDSLRAVSPFFIRPTNKFADSELLLNAIESQNTFICEYAGTAKGGSVNVVSGYLNNFGNDVLKGGRALEFAYDGTTLTRVSTQAYSPQVEFGYKIAALISDNIYAFEPERYNLGTCATGNSKILAPDASNLAAVLDVLQAHPAKWKKFNDYVRYVFPQIHAVSVEPTPGNTVTIKIWNEDPLGIPQELAINLSESGTGVGQVLSVLCVVLSADYPRTIIIDEPQSFLHPRALRTLVEILADQPGYQFVIATHSPTVITAAQPQRILRTLRTNAQTEVQLLDLGETENLRLFLADIGARLSDVFGAERILWVDGETEETCFPEIVKASKQYPHYGTKILGVRQTGDFEGKHSKTIFEIYTRLSTGEGLLPPAVGFLFDREGRNSTLRTDLTRQGKGRVKFLDRRMFENYLLNSNALEAIFKEIPGFREKPIMADEIERHFENSKTNPDLIDPKFHGKSHDTWLTEVNGARLLLELFQTLSETRFRYNKIEHGLKLTRYILANSPDAFSEIAEKIRTLLDA